MHACAAAELCRTHLTWLALALGAARNVSPMTAAVRGSEGAAQQHDGADKRPNRRSRGPEKGRSQSCGGSWVECLGLATWAIGAVVVVAGLMQGGSSHIEGSSSTSDYSSKISDMEVLSGTALKLLKGSRLQRLVSAQRLCLRCALVCIGCYHSMDWIGAVFKHACAAQWCLGKQGIRVGHMCTLEHAVVVTVCNLNLCLCFDGYFLFGVLYYRMGSMGHFV